MRKISLIILTCFIALLAAEKIDHFTDMKTDNIIPRGKDKLLDYEQVWEVDETDEFEGFSYVSEIVSYKEKLYLLDAEEWIQIFNTEGEFIAQYGIKGKGPGEIVLMKDFAIYNDFIYNLDKGKYTISKYDLDFNHIWEKKLPGEYIEKLSPEEIEVNNNGILIGGFSTNSKLDNIPILFVLNEEMEIIGQHFNYQPQKGSDPYGVMAETATRFSAEDDNIYFGNMAGLDYLYKYNLFTESIDFVLTKKTPQSGKYEMKQRADGGTELMCYFNALDINSSENYIVAGESCGAFEKEKDKIKVPKGYVNNVALYKKDGTYLGSYINDENEYTYVSYTAEVEESDGKVYIYLIHGDEGILRKILVRI